MASDDGKGSFPRRKASELPFDDDELTAPLRPEDRKAHGLPSTSGPRRMPRPEQAPAYVHPLPDGPEAAPPYPPENVGEPGFLPAFLYVERGPGAGQLMPVRQGALLIGRGNEAGLRVQHPSISRRHSQITRAGDRFFIRDLASQNGTYVNAAKIDGEVEIFPGDELVVGIAQLRLRGANGPEAGVAVAPTEEPTPQAMAQRGPSTLTVAILAAVLGFGFAALVMFVYFKLNRGPSFEEVEAAPVAQAAPAHAVVEPAPAAEGTEAEVAAASGAVEAERTTEDGLPPVEDPLDELAPLPSRPKPAPAPARAVSRPADAPAAASAPAPAESKVEGTTVADFAAAEPTVMARYEMGNVAEAINLARKKNVKPTLLSTLMDFEVALDSAQRAAAADDRAGALRGYESALKLDEQLTRGWGKYSVHVRHQLATLHLAQGNELLGRDPAAAEKAFHTALRYEPENAAAAQQLRTLGGGDAAPKTTPKGGRK